MSVIAFAGVSGLSVSGTDLLKRYSTAARWVAVWLVFETLKGKCWKQEFKEKRQKWRLFKINMHRQLNKCPSQQQTRASKDT